MKKYLLGAASLLVVAAAAIGGYSYYQEQQVDPIIRENIEALSQIEPGGGGKVTCYSVIENDSSKEAIYNVVKCENCMSVDCTNYSSESNCKK